MMMKELRRLFRYLKPHLWNFTFATLAMLAVGILQSAIGALIVPIFDQAFAPNGKAVHQTPTLYGLQNLIPSSGVGAWRNIALLLILFTIAKGIAEYLSTYLMARVGQESVMHLRRDLYNHLLSQSAVFFERHRTNYLVSRLVSSA
ncbi:MAG: ABC transporter transmembrane domain-containing protein, partial [Pyrinomonadaceae bacterium]